jgi:hypothetical protein
VQSCRALDLDDVLRARRGQHARHVGPTRAQHSCDVVLRPAVQKYIRAALIKDIRSRGPASSRESLSITVVNMDSSEPRHGLLHRVISAVEAHLIEQCRLSRPTEVVHERAAGHDRSKVGLHARPASLFAKAVKEVGVPVQIAKDGKPPGQRGEPAEAC